MAPALDGLPAEVPVLIVGAGPVGLTAALCFAELGVEALLVERRLPGAKRSPSAHVISQRSLEVLRSVGAKDKVCSMEGGGFPGEIAFVDRVGGTTFACIDPNDFAAAALGALQACPPEHARMPVNPLEAGPTVPFLNLAQPALEEALVQVLQSQHPPHAHPCFGCNVERVEEVDGAVVATVATPHGRCSVRCQYLLACDGARSRIRESLGIQLESTVPHINPAAYDPRAGVIQHHVWIHFTADLSRFFKDNPYGPVLYWYHAETISGLLINYNGREEWVMHFPFFPGEELHPDEWSEADCQAKVTEMMGERLPDLVIRGKGAWQMTCAVATSYQAGRIFLAGDACHRFPPSGGHGQNTGIVDVHNLAWKVSAVLQGWAGPALLESYEEERWPVGRFNADQSARNNKQMAEIEAALGMSPASPWKSKAEYQRSLRHLQTARVDNDALAQAIKRSMPHWVASGQALGYSYEEGALVPDGTAFRQELMFLRQDDVSDGTVLVYDPTTRPGSRLPHFWVSIAQGAERRRRGVLSQKLPPSINKNAAHASLHDCIAWDAITLLTADAGPPGVSWAEVVTEVRKSCRVPLMHVHLAVGPSAPEPKSDMLLVPLSDNARETLEIAERGSCLLVRPDETVAFRARSPTAATLVGALRQIARTDGAGRPLPALPNPCRRGGDWPPPKPKGRLLDVSKVVPPAAFAHVVLRTRDLEGSIKWYGNVIGAMVVQRSAFLAFLTYDQEHHRLALVATPQKAALPPGAAGLDHLSYTVKDLGSLLQTYARLKQQGLMPWWTVNHGPTTSMYYRDPDGNGVELQVDNFATEKELKGFMTSEIFEKNQIGVEFDPEELLQRYLRGDPIDKLLRQGAVGTSPRPKL